MWLIHAVLAAVGDPTSTSKAPPFWFEAVQTLGIPTVCLLGALYGLHKEWWVPGAIYRREVARADFEASERRTLEKEIRNDVIPELGKSTAASADVVRTLGNFDKQIDRWVGRGG